MQLRPLVLGMMTAATFSFAACHNEEPQTVSGAEAQLRAGSAPAAHTCPMGVSGTSVKAADAPSGIALDFATTAGPNEVAELQRRIHAMSTAGTLGMTRGPGTGGGLAGRVAARDTSGTARSASRVEDTPTGARVTLEPAPGESIDALRARVRAHVPRMASNTACMRARASK